MQIVDNQWVLYLSEHLTVCPSACSYTAFFPLLFPSSGMSHTQSGFVRAKYEALPTAEISLHLKQIMVRKKLEESDTRLQIGWNYHPDINTCTWELYLEVAFLYPNQQIWLGYNHICFNIGMISISRRFHISNELMFLKKMLSNQCEMRNLPVWWC